MFGLLCWILRRNLDIFADWIEVPGFDLPAHILESFWFPVLIHDRNKVQKDADKKGI